MRLLPCGARRPSLPSPGRPAHQILSLASLPGSEGGCWVLGSTYMDKGKLPGPSVPLGPGWCQQSSDSDGALATRPRLWPHQELPGTGVIRSTPSPGLGERPVHCLQRCLHEAPRRAPSLIEDSRQTPDLPMTYDRQAECGSWSLEATWFLWALSSLHGPLTQSFPQKRTRQELS